MARRTLVAVPLFCVALVVSLAFIAAEMALRCGTRRLPAGSSRAAAEVARSTGAALTDAEVRAADGARLRGWLFQQRPNSDKSVILLHGIGDTRNGMLGHAQFFLTHGYDVVVPDSRAQGESGGDLITYGVLEARDVGSWAAWVRGQTRARCVFALGESFGAGVTIQAATAGNTTLCAAVAESPFASFRDAACLRVGQQAGGGEALGRMLGFPLVEPVIIYTRMRYGVNLGDASPVDAVRRLRIPLLVIHGTADGNIPIDHSRRIVRAAAGRVAYWEVPGGNHTDALSREPAEFARRVLGLFETAHAFKH